MVCHASRNLAGLRIRNESAKFLNVIFEIPTKAGNTTPTPECKRPRNSRSRCNRRYAGIAMPDAVKGWSMSLQLSNVVKNDSNVEVLHDISLEVYKGDFLVLLGGL